MAFTDNTSSGKSGMLLSECFFFKNQQNTSRPIRRTVNSLRKMSSLVDGNFKAPLPALIDLLPILRLPPARFVNTSAILL